MADWSALVKGFQGGSDWAQDFRANRQFEKARDQALERGEYDLESTRAFRKTTNPDAAGVLGSDYAAGNTNWSGQLEDPFAFKLFNWAKGKLSGKGKKRKAIDLGADSGSFGSSNPVGTGEETYAADTYAVPEQEQVESESFADGGEIMAAMEAARGQTQGFASQASAVPQTTVQAAGAQPIPSATGVLATGRGYADGRMPSKEAEEWQSTRDDRARTGRETVDRSSAEVRRSPVKRAVDVALDRTEVAKRPGLANLGRRALTRTSRVAGRAGPIAALGATALEAFNTPTEDYRERFGLETDDPSLLGDVGVRTLGAASDLGNAMTLGAAGRLYRDKQRKEAAAVPQQALPAETENAPTQLPDITLGEASQGTAVRRSALPSSSATDPDVVDFGGIDIDAKDVPDMKTGDWKKYRAEMIAAAQKSGNPEAVSRVNDMVTEMQMKGFQSYGMQGLALQEAGNIRGAMAAYRAAFQYFPNGNDVEFGTSKNKRTGRQQIIGFGRDEKTGKIVPGSEMLMDPERVSVLINTVTKTPDAYRMWTKDHRDFKEGQRTYEEVTKPLAQAQADALANTSEARILAAENMALRMGGLGGAGGAANLRNAERVFRERLGMMGLQDEAQADYLASIMSQVKVANPNVPDNTIVQAIMAAAQDGTLGQRLQRMGVGAGAQPAAAPSALPSPARRALPAGGEQDLNNPPPGVDTQAWFSPNMRGLSYEERVMASTPAR